MAWSYTHSSEKLICETDELACISPLRQYQTKMCALTVQFPSRTREVSVLDVILCPPATLALFPAVTRACLDATVPFC